MISVRDSGFSGRGVLMQRRKTGREEKKNEKENGKGGMSFHISSYVLSYVFKSAVELELFSKLWYFKYYFF